MKNVKFKYIGVKKRWWDDKVEFNGTVYYLHDLTELPQNVFEKAKKEGKVEKIEVKKEKKDVS